MSDRPWLSDDELREATCRRQPSAQARALQRMGVRFLRRPDGTLLVGRQAIEKALSGEPATMGTSTASNGLKWRKRA